MGGGVAGPNSDERNANIGGKEATEIRSAAGRENKEGEKRTKKFVTVIATVITIGQLVVAIVTLMGVREKNAADDALSRQEHKENVDKSQFDEKMREDAAERDLLRIVLDKLPELQKPESTDLRRAFSQVSGDLPSSPAGKTLNSIILNTVPAGAPGRQELASLEEGLAAKHVGLKSANLPIVVFIHYLNRNEKECAGQVAEILKAQGIVARVDAGPRPTGETHIDYYNGDEPTASGLAKILAPILKIAPKLKAKSSEEAKNYFGLWLKECSVASVDASGEPNVQ